MSATPIAWDTGARIAALPTYRCLWELWMSTQGFTGVRTAGAYPLPRNWAQEAANERPRHAWTRAGVWKRV